MTVTERQLEVLNTIRDLWDQRLPPTYAAIADRLGISRATAFEHVRQLEKAGRIVRTPGRAGSITVVDDGV